MGRPRSTPRLAIRKALHAERVQLDALVRKLDVVPDDIIERAVACFESADAAAGWLAEPTHSALDGISVFEAAKTHAGRERVRHLLGAIEHGVFL